MDDALEIFEKRLLFFQQHTMKVVDDLKQGNLGLSNQDIQLEISVKEILSAEGGVEQMVQEARDFLLS